MLSSGKLLFQPAGCCAAGHKSLFENLQILTVKLAFSCFNLGSAEISDLCFSPVLHTSFAAYLVGTAVRSQRSWMQHASPEPHRQTTEEQRQLSALLLQCTSLRFSQWRLTISSKVEHNLRLWVLAFCRPELLNGPSFSGDAEPSAQWQWDLLYPVFSPPRGTFWNNGLLNVWKM